MTDAIVVRSPGLLRSGRSQGPVPSAATGAAASGYELLWARHADQVRAAQRLRYRVFAGELGAHLASVPGADPDVDADRFDPHCEHLLVRTRATVDAPARVVGTYRVLTPAAARRLGGLYSETEFDLRPLDAERGRMLELGRSCVDPQHRDGAVILLLWSALARFMRDNGLDLAIGCASVSMRDGGHTAASLYHRLAPQHLAPTHWRVRARVPLPMASLRQDLPVEAPPLIRGYLRCGAQLLGEPAWDPDFGVADLPLLLGLDALPAGLRRRFLSP